MKTRQRSNSIGCTLALTFAILMPASVAQAETVPADLPFDGQDIVLWDSESADASTSPVASTGPVEPRGALGPIREDLMSETTYFSTSDGSVTDNTDSWLFEAQPLP